MKIKLIIILFGISCLFFPGGLMEADAFPIGIFKPIIREIGEITVPAFVKIKGAQLGIKYVNAVDLCSSIKWEARHQKICNEDDQVEFEEVKYEQYGFTIQTPTSWQPYDVTSSMVELNEDPNVPETVILMFSDDSDIFNTEAAGFFVVINYFADGSKFQKMQNVVGEYKEILEVCDGTPDEFGYVCSDARIIGSEENGNTTMVKIISEDKVDVYSQFETTITKFIVIQTDRFHYQLIFGDTSSDFALYSVLYDHIEDTFDVTQSGGGCLIATAAFGSEMAPQVQFLRELRDNTVLQTQSGTSFMTGFNQFYYSFSPTIADYERENPAFKEAVKLTLTPLLASLTLLQYVDIDSESEMLGYGIGVILLNIGMYFVAPAVLIMKVRAWRQSLRYDQV